MPRLRFNPGESPPPGTHYTGGWVGPRAGLDTEARKKYFRLCRESNLDRPVVQSVARHYKDWAASAPLYNETSTHLPQVNGKYFKRKQMQNQKLARRPVM
jgi:hypothetical protein